MSSYRKCAVFGCEDLVSNRHRFPQPEKFMDTFKLWLNACGNELLTSLPPDLIYRSHRVCNRHFIFEEKSRNNRLCRGAVPKLFLPESASAVVADPIATVAESTEHATEFVNIPSTPTVDANIKDAPSDEPSTSGLMPFTKRSLSPMEDLPSTPKKQKMNTQLLKDLGVTRLCELTPKARKMYKRALQFKTKSRQLLKGKNLFKKRLYEWEHITNENLVEKLTAPLDKTVANFIKSQIKLHNVAPKGRRFSIDDKILGLILYKQSRRGYKLLSKLFSLPSRKTITQLLNRIPIKAGISDSIFDALKVNVTQLRPIDRHCILMFDEMSIQAHLHFNRKSGEVEGFEDLGDKRSKKIADHAQVFMVKGITKKWKQPVCFTFSKNATETMDLVRLIKRVIGKCQEAGLTIVATVSDQGSTNQAAVNYLKRQAKEKALREGVEMNDLYYDVNEQCLVHIYDPPHLIKGIRNNLLNKFLILTKKDRKLIAKWSDIQKAYQIDNPAGEFRAMPKLTDVHVNPDKIKKMKVSVAAQVLSHNVAAVISLLARSGMSGSDGTKLEKEAQDTAEIIMFWDKVFDSVNGFHKKAKGGKILRSAVTATSPHLPFWKEAKETIAKMYFQKFDGTKVSDVPTLKNWILTLSGFEEIYKMLTTKNITFFSPRVFNQDPLENFFGQMRQHGFRNVNPTVVNFVCNFKTLLISNFISSHSVSANCENEESKNIITSVRHFVTQGVAEEEMTDIHNINYPVIELGSMMVAAYKSFIDKVSIGYVSGFITKNLKEFNTCAVCKNNLYCMPTNIISHALTQEKEYNKKAPSRLNYCTPEVIDGIMLAYDIIIKLWPQICHKQAAFKLLLAYVLDKVEFKFKNICEHSADLVKQILLKFALLSVHNWCNGINKKLTGKCDRPGKMYNIFEETILKNKKRFR